MSCEMASRSRAAPRRGRCGSLPWPLRFSANRPLPPEAPFRQAVGSPSPPRLGRARRSERRLRSHAAATARRERLHRPAPSNRNAWHGDSDCFSEPGASNFAPSQSIRCCKCCKNWRRFTLPPIPLYNHLEQLVAPHSLLSSFSGIAQKSHQLLLCSCERLAK